MVFSGPKKKKRPKSRLMLMESHWICVLRIAGLPLTDNSNYIYLTIRGKNMNGKIVGLLLLLFSSLSQADSTITYTAPNDPTSQGFSLWSFNGTGASNIITNDSGYNALQLTSNTIQYAYTAPLPASVLNNALVQGWSLDATARIVSGITGEADGVILADFSANQRFDITLSTNSNGAAVVTLDQSYNLGSNPWFQPVGQNYIINGSANSYHNYDLIFNPQTQSATLYVDGVNAISGYTGYSSNTSDMVYFGAVNSGSINFANVNFSVPASSTVPIPTAAWLFGSALAGLIGFNRKKSI